MKKLTLHGCKGCGSAIVEAALVLAKLPYTFVDANYEDPIKLAELKKINPLGQVPTLVLENGQILTESAAIINYIHQRVPEAKLIPTNPEINVEYWRWLCFLIGAIYPTFTYGDFPAKWTNEVAGPLLKNSTDEWRKTLWRQVEGKVDGKWFLSEFSALDLYLAVMVYWRPRRPWFKDHCPQIDWIASKIHEMPALKEVFNRNFT